MADIVSNLTNRRLLLDHEPSVYCTRCRRNPSMEVTHGEDIGECLKCYLAELKGEFLKRMGIPMLDFRAYLGERMRRGEWSLVQILAETMVNTGAGLLLATYERIAGLPSAEVK